MVLELQGTKRIKLLVTYGTKIHVSYAHKSRNMAIKGNILEAKSMISRKPTMDL
jgi:hypothetical protein